MSVVRCLYEHKFFLLFELFCLNSDIQQFLLCLENIRSVPKQAVCSVTDIVSTVRCLYKDKSV